MKLTSKLNFVLFGILSAFAVADLAVAQALPQEEKAPPQAQKKWTCEADGLAEFRYSGSDWAYIRLSAYESGHEYRVTKDPTGDTAKGSTKDGTLFVCKKV